MAHRITVVPPTRRIGALTRPNFLPNTKSLLDADHFGLNKAMRLLIEYLAVVCLQPLNQALIAQEVEMVQTKIQEGTPQKAIDGP